MNKRGEILVENVIFIVLNLMFLTILILFIVLKSGSVATIEEKYSKQIALLIDASYPGMEIEIEMEDAFKKAEKEKWEGDILSIYDNVVRVQLREDGGYEYSFFNDVNVNPYPSKNEDNENTGYYTIIISEK